MWTMRADYTQFEGERKCCYHHSADFVVGPSTPFLFRLLWNGDLQFEGRSSCINFDPLDAYPNCDEIQYWTVGGWKTLSQDDLNRPKL